MRIKTKILMSTSTIVFSAMLFTMLSALYILDQGLNLQTKALLDGLHARSGHRLVAGNKVLQNSLESYIKGFKHLTLDFCQNEILKKRIAKGEWESLSPPLETLARRAGIDFVVIFNPEGKVKAAWPHQTAPDYYETRFKTSPLLKKIKNYSQNKELTDSPVLASFEKWDRIHKKNSDNSETDSVLPFVLAGFIPNDSSDKVSGYILTGITSARLSLPFKNFFSTTEQFSLLTNGKNPLVWAGFPGVKSSIKNSLIPFNRENRMKSASGHTLSLFQHNGKGYHVHTAPFLDFSAGKTTGFDDPASYSLMTGEPSDLIFKAAKKIKHQGERTRKSIIGSTLLIATILFILAMCIVNMIVEKISSPIALAAEAAKHIASGDFTRLLPESGSDETGLLSRSMNIMTKNLNRFRQKNENQMEALRESHRKNEIILNSILNGVLIIDQETHEIIDANPAARAMIGAERDEIIGKICHRYVCPTEKGACPISDKNEKMDNSERILLTKNRDNIPILKTVVPVILKGRRCLLESFVDISKLKQAEEELKKHRDQLEEMVNKRTLALRESELLFRSIFDLSPQAIALTEIETGRIVDVNNKYCELTQCKKDELIGLTTTELNFYSKEDRNKFLEGLQNSGDVQGLKMNFQIKDGSVINALMYAKKLRISQKTFILTTFVNVTDRWKAEKALIESENKYRTILDNSDTGYYEIDIAGNFTFVSDALCKIFMTKREDLIGLNYKKHTSEETARRLFLIYNKIFTRGIPKKRFEYQIYIKDRQTRIIETSVSPIKNLNEKIVGFSGLGRDVTEQRNLEAQLQNVQKIEAIGTLAGGIAHDFNNILAAILGYAELAKINSLENPKVQRYIEQLCLASERAKSLVLQILSFSRQTKAEKKPIDIGIVVQEALKLLRASIPSTIEIRQNVKLNTGTVEADATQIHQIVMNLCANSFHAMEEDGGLLDVDLIPVEITTNDSLVYHNIKPGNYLELRVKDTGHGISQDTMSRIFDPYFTTKEVGKGSGMGLATVHGIVKSHGGYIKVYSEQNSGTTFHILFPLIHTHAEEIPEESSPLPRGREKILFIDDEQFLIEIGKEALENLGYRVDTRISSYEAWETFRKEPEKYDIIITDMTMPEMTGIKLARKIKKIRPEIPIILCTGYSKSITPESVMQIGIDTIMIKPLTIEKLADTVRDLLDND